MEDDPTKFLTNYVSKRDPTYGWEVVSLTRYESFTDVVLKLVSQNWLDESDVDEPEWSHWLRIIIPDAIQSSTAALYVVGGRTDAPPPTHPPERSLTVALITKTVVADLGMVPNQPLRFADSPHNPRIELDLVGYCRAKYMRSNEPRYLLLPPMVKSLIRAMDAIQEYLSTRRMSVDRFVLFGGSKRAWPCWISGALDSRVAGIVSLAMDSLNATEVLRRQYHACGFLHETLAPYLRHGLFPVGPESPSYRAMMLIDDAYSYFDRLPKHIPKYLLNSSCCTLTHPDSSKEYFSNIPGEKYLRYIPNADHDLKNSDALQSILSFYESIATGHPRPEFSWSLENDTMLRIRSNDQPRSVTLWQVTNRNGRDFRITKTGRSWRKTVLAPDASRSYVAYVPTPASGYTAFFAELEYDSPFGGPFVFTTDVNIIPDSFPYDLKMAKDIRLG